MWLATHLVWPSNKITNTPFVKMIATSIWWALRCTVVLIFLFSLNFCLFEPLTQPSWTNRRAGNSSELLPLFPSAGITGMVILLYFPRNHKLSPLWSAVLSGYFNSKNHVVKSYSLAYHKLMLQGNAAFVALSWCPKGCYEPCCVRI